MTGCFRSPHLGHAAVGRWRDVCPSRCIRRGQSAELRDRVCHLARAALLRPSSSASRSKSRDAGSLPGLSLQPSEIRQADPLPWSPWLFSEQKLRPRFPGNVIGSALCSRGCRNVDKQPEYRMAAVRLCGLVSRIFFMKLGLRLYRVAAGALAVIAGLVALILPASMSGSGSPIPRPSWRQLSR